MRSLAFALTGTGMAAFLVATRTGEWNLHLLTGFLVVAAACVLAVRDGSTFLKIPLATFGWEAVVLGLCTLARAEGAWPAWLADLAVPSTAVMTLTLLVIVLAALWSVSVVRRCLVIADRYFDRDDRLGWRLPGGRCCASASAISDGRRYRSPSCCVRSA
ncbi:hypothetical protein [Methylorubrum sp. SL192]|uniref:hypothetical protein n=1 Tax=Methylorubrum sp. SL192 TaxID=2995167 RepID=UPI002273753C|nr:hypothetical protein [Methylorubrum sp. SL192]MCY1644722.1 hypothetical protein [Methylorubrum sp. SL192]